MTTFQWDDGSVAAALGLEGATPDTGRYGRVSTDTRAIEPGDLFVALVGEHHDAHDFLAQAAESGATGAVVSRLPDNAPGGLRLFHVQNTLTALGALGRYRRDRFGGRVVGVVGSNGKTTTKDLIRATLSPRYSVHATQGNLNNQIGAPLTLLGAPEESEVLVVEMGTNEPGEIAILADIVRPDAVVITSIGEEHLEKLGSLSGVLEEEISILRGLTPGGPVFVAEEPEALPTRTRALVGGERVRVAGFAAGADLHPDGSYEGIEVQPDGSTRWKWSGQDVHLPIPGRVNVRNALLALGLATEWGVPPAAAASAVGNVARAKLRGEWKQFGDMRVLADCYNSNPPSVSAAVDLLASLPASGRKVAVLGTMRELGASAAELHARAAAELVSRLGTEIDLVVATGEFVAAFAPFADRVGDRLISEVDPVEAYGATVSRMQGNELVLLKASRGEALERWLPMLERDFTVTT